MDMLSSDKYTVSLVPPERTALDDALEHLAIFLSDRSIPESQKVEATLQYNHLMKLKLATVQMPILRLTPKANYKKDDDEPINGVASGSFHDMFQQALNPGGTIDEEDI